MKYTEDIQIFVMNMTFVSSSEVKKIYIHDKNLNFLSIIYKLVKCLVLNVAQHNIWGSFTI